MLSDILNTTELMVDPLTRDNMKFIIFKCSLNEAMSEVMLKSGVCTMLILLLSKYVVNETSVEDHGYLSTAEQTQIEQQKKDQSNERCVIMMYCATVLKNISLLPKLLPLMVAAKDMDSILELISKSKLNVVAMDLATVLFFTCRNKQLNHTSPLSPKLVLEIVTALDDFDSIPTTTTNTNTTNTNSQESGNVSGSLTGAVSGSSVDMHMVGRVTKHIIGIVLDEYSMGAGVHPSFIQSMYSEIQDRTSADIPIFMDTLESISMTMPNEVIAEQPIIVYDPFIEQDTQWNTIEERLKKEIRTDFYSRSRADPLVSEDILTVDLPEMIECSKMNKSYSLVALEE